LGKVCEYKMMELVGGRELWLSIHCRGMSLYCRMLRMQHTCPIKNQYFGV
jgi:hypothetical protein